MPPASACWRPTLTGDHKQYLALIARFFEQRVEGLFLVSPADLGDSLIDYRRASVPVIALLGKDPSAGRTPPVAASEKHGIHEAIAALAGMGHREIAYVLRFWDEVRLREIKDAFAALGLAPSSASMVFEPGYDDATVCASVRKALTLDSRPTALVVHSTLLAPAVAAIEDLGLSLPRDVSLVSIGASSWHQLLHRGIAAVEADSRAIGQLGCRLMLDWIEGREPRGDHSELAVWSPRGSVAPAPASGRGR